MLEPRSTGLKLITGRFIMAAPILDQMYNIIKISNTLVNYTLALSMFLFLYLHI